MILDTDLVLSQVLQMKNDITDNQVITKDEYKIMYSYLAEKAPTLFDIVYKNEIDYVDYVKYMITNAVKVGNNELSQYDADVVVGQKLADDYIHPNIDMEKEKNGKE